MVLQVNSKSAQNGARKDIYYLSVALVPISQGLDVAATPGLSEEAISQRMDFSQAWKQRAGTRVPQAGLGKWVSYLDAPKTC